MSEEVFLDTSAVFAYLSPGDSRHPKAVDAFARLGARRAPLVTTSYVLVESYALLARRLGMAAARAFGEHIAPLCDVLWVDAALQDEGFEAWIERGSRHLSLVDCVSFVVMNRRGIDSAFAYDDDFAKAGFLTL